MKLPADVQQLLARRFDARHRDWLVNTGAEAHWPLTVPLGMPTEQSAMRQVDAVREWVAQWRAWRGPGALEWADRQWRVLGAQHLPDTLTLAEPSDVAAWIGQQERWTRARFRFVGMTARWPVLAQRLPRLFSVLADYDDTDFDRLSRIVEWIIAHPRSSLYPRQLPIAGIDSKWLESRTGIIAELIQQLTGNAAVTDFYSLCGLKRTPVQVRIRILDPALRQCTGGISDLTAPIDDLARLELPVSTVFIVENLQTGLAFEDTPGAVVFMALGYSVDLLRRIPWIARARCLYWGDIDTHGFAILHRARCAIPGLSSVLMDEETLLRFSTLWSSERSQDLAADPTMLTGPELDVYQGLRQQRYGQNVRLEQERIAWDHAWQALTEVKL